MSNIVACRTYNLKLDEDEFAKLAELYSDIGELSKDKMKEYVNIIDEIVNNAVVSGNLHNKLELFQETIKLYESVLENSCNELSKKLKEFVVKVDEKDSDLYGNGIYSAYWDRGNKQWELTIKK
mgnify:FL=1